MADKSNNKSKADLRAETTAKNKKRFLESLEKNAGIVLAASNAVNISRTTHYEWINTDAEYAKAVELIREKMVDIAEGVLVKQMLQNNSEKSAMFVLKYKGRKRGWVEQETSKVVVNNGGSFDEEFKKLPIEKQVKILEILETEEQEANNE